MSEEQSLEEFASSGVLPELWSEFGLADTKLDPLQGVLICDSISGGADYVDDMPKRLSLVRRDNEGNEYRAEYVQVLK